MAGHIAYSIYGTREKGTGSTGNNARKAEFYFDNLGINGEAVNLVIDVTITRKSMVI